MTRIGAALDRILLQGMRLAFHGAHSPPAADLEQFIASGRPYHTPELEADPRRFFAFLDAPMPRVDVRVRRVRPIPLGAVWGLRFKSLYEPFCAAGASRGACSENDTVHVQHWRHEVGPKRPIVILIHGFTMGHPAVDAHVMMASAWYALGYDVALPVLPFHGARAAATDRYSGERFGTWDLGRVNEAVRQAVHDVALVRHWLRAAEDAPVGIAGLSLGGYLTALLAGLLDDWAFAVPIAAPVRLDALPSLLAGADPCAVLTGVGRRPSEPEAVRRAFTVHSPLTYRLRTPIERVLIVAGRGDRVVPSEHVTTLWRHWGEPAIHWFCGSHVAPFQRRGIMAAVQRHAARVAPCATPVEPVQHPSAFATSVTP